MCVVHKEWRDAPGWMLVCLAPACTLHSLSFPSIYPCLCTLGCVYLIHLSAVYLIHLSAVYLNHLSPASHSSIYLCVCVCACVCMSVCVYIRVQEARRRRRAIGVRRLVMEDHQVFAVSLLCLCLNLCSSQLPAGCMCSIPPVHCALVVHLCVCQSTVHLCVCSPLCTCVYAFMAVCIQGVNRSVVGQCAQDSVALVPH